jgi:hypothetical protein
VEKYGTARQATDDSIIGRMRFACWITNATDTHSEYVIRSGYVNALQLIRVHCQSSAIFLKNNTQQNLPITEAYFFFTQVLEV